MIAPTAETFEASRSVGGPISFSNPGTPESHSGTEGSTDLAPEQWGIYLGLPYRINTALVAHPILQHPLSLVGIHPWMVQAYVERTEGKVSRVHYLTLVERSDGAKVVSIVDIAKSSLLEDSSHPLYRIGYSTLRTTIPMLRAFIYPNLPMADRTRLTTYSLNCLNTLKGCQEPAEISPGLWEAYLRQQN